MSIWSLALLKKLGPEENILVQQNVLNPWDTVLILTLCSTNIVCTCKCFLRLDDLTSHVFKALISFRILSSYRKVPSVLTNSSRQSGNLGIIGILVECG